MDEDVVTATNVLLYIPNLIGYVRVICTLMSFICAHVRNGEMWLLATILYITSFAGDLFDGYAARRFDQCSTFGGVLDMVTDRCSTAGLLVILSWVYSDPYKFVFLFLIILDISSHWCQMYSTAVLRLHHKSSEALTNRNFIVRWFYTVYPFFGYCCVGAEFTYISLFALANLCKGGLEEVNFDLWSSWNPDSMWATIWWNCFLLCFPACVMKQVVNVSQLISACSAIAHYDAEIKNSKN